MILGLYYKIFGCLYFIVIPASLLLVSKGLATGCTGVLTLKCTQG